MKSKVYIHVGMQKTGSTWLQDNVFPQIDTHDLIYKESFRELMYRLTGKDKIISYENYVGYPHLVESRGYNGFLRTRQAALSNLGRLFPDADIILVVRNQADFIKSIYNQYIKVGGSISFVDYWRGSRETSLEREALVYSNLITELKEVFSGRILVIDFGLFKSDKDKFLKLFGDFVGGINSIDINDTRGKMVNESLSPNQLRAMLFVSRYFGNYYNPSSLIHLHLRLFKAVRLFTVKFLKVFFSSEKIESDDMMQEIKDYYAEDWAALSGKLSEGYFIVDQR